MVSGRRDDHGVLEKQQLGVPVASASSRGGGALTKEHANDGRPDRWTGRQLDFKGCNASLAGKAFVAQRTTLSRQRRERARSSPFDIGLSSDSGEPGWERERQFDRSRSSRALKLQPQRYQAQSRALTGAAATPSKLRPFPDPKKICAWLASLIGV